MKQVKRFFYMVLLNIIISAITVGVVLKLWEQDHPALPADRPPSGCGRKTNLRGRVGAEEIGTHGSVMIHPAYIIEASRSQAVAVELHDDLSAGTLLDVEAQWQSARQTRVAGRSRPPLRLCAATTAGERPEGTRA